MYVPVLVTITNHFNSIVMYFCVCAIVPVSISWLYSSKHSFDSIVSTFYDSNNYKHSCKYYITPMNVMYIVRISIASYILY